MKNLSDRYASSLNETVDVYDIDGYIRKETDGEYKAFRYNDGAAIIICDDGFGMMMDYEAVGQSFNSMNDTVEIGIVSATDGDNGSWSVVPTHRAKCTIEELVNGAPVKEMTYGEFFRKADYNWRCSDNYRNMIDELKEHGMFSNMDESLDEEVLNEEPIYDLAPQYDSRQSFYSKARVHTGQHTDDGKSVVLYSYNTPVAKITDGKVCLMPKWDSSQTTLRHVKEFLLQNGFEAGSKKEIASKYEMCNESLTESLTYPYDLDNLSQDDLWKLRQEINLNSIYINDYVNSFGIDPHACCDFFDGFMEYIGELMDEDGVKDSEFWDKIDEYDTPENLYNWYGCVEHPFGESMHESKRVVKGRKSLTESRWKYELKNGKALRSAINEGDIDGVLAMMQLCYQELADKGVIDQDECDSYVSDLDIYDADDEDIEDSVDYELSTLYDICDACGVWIGL